MRGFTEKDESSKGILFLWCFVSESEGFGGVGERLPSKLSSTEWTRKLDVKLKKKCYLITHNFTTPSLTPTLNQFSGFELRTSHCWSNQDLNSALSTEIAFTKTKLAFVKC